MSRGLGVMAGAHGPSCARTATRAYGNSTAIVAACSHLAGRRTAPRDRDFFSHRKLGVQSALLVELLLMMRPIRNALVHH
eukprot:SAG25_NODE_319_length_9948_cov_30.028328_12_plen_80_part_00